MHRRHHRLLSLLAFGVLALAAELIGRSLTHRLDIGRHVAAPSYHHAAYYPFLVGAVKVGIALLLARLAWRFARARATERAARGLLERTGALPHLAAPRVRLELSPRVAAATFALTSLAYLGLESLDGGAASPLAPWIHSSALPVFAVLSVGVALLWRVVARWLSAYETYARETAAVAQALATRRAPARRLPRPAASDSTVRRLFGLVFESRPPPVPV